MDRRDAETQRENIITEKLIGCAIEVHKALGPGLLESAYEECLCYELSHAGFSFERQASLRIIYKGVNLDCGYRIDVVIEKLVIVELKAIERILPIHEAQLLSYLKLYGSSVGLLINFNVPILKNGLKRIVNNFQEISASPRLCGEKLFGRKGAM